MNRTELQLLADSRVADADVLLRERHWPAAYYILGYSVECALKACAARQFRQDEVPDKKLVERFYTHDLNTLLNLSGAKPAFDERCAADSTFAVNWNTVRDWNESYRYDASIPELKVRDLWIAVTDSNSGILPWLKTQW